MATVFDLFRSTPATAPQSGTVFERFRSSAPSVSRASPSQPEAAQPWQVDPYDRNQHTREVANVVALRLAKKLNGRTPTRGELDILSRYSGWGGLNLEALPKDVAPENDNGLIWEFYTPAGLASAAWSLLSRNHLVAVGARALEPSAGVGRFVETCPFGLSWTLVEMEPGAAAVLRSRFGDSPLSERRNEVFVGPFQQYMVDTEKLAPAVRDFDIIMANPPYSIPGSLISLDPKGKRWSTNVSYFMTASARRLKPGGVMVHLVPAGVMTGAGAASYGLRKELLLECQFLGAYLPPSGIFPGARLQTVLCLWRKRAVRLAEVRPEDREILEGRWVKLRAGMGRSEPGGPVGGRVEASSRYKRAADVGTEREAVEVVGAFDPDHLVALKLRLDETDHLVQTEALPGKEGRKARTSSPPSSSSPAPRMEPRPAVPKARGLAGRLAAAMPARAKDFDADAMLDLARKLGERLIRLNAGDSRYAAQAQQEVRLAVERWLAFYGNPHSIPEVLASQERSVLAMLRAVTQDGKLAPILTEKFHNAWLLPAKGQDLVGVVTWLCDRDGVATLTDIAAMDMSLQFTDRHALDLAVHRIDSEEDARVLAPGLPVKVGELLLWTKEAYLASALWEKLEACKRVTGNPLVDAGRNWRRQWLLEAIDPLNIDDITLDLRSRWIPLACFSDYLSEVSARKITLEMKDDLYHIVGSEALEEDAIKRGDLGELLAYMNHVNQVAGQDEDGGVSRRSRHKGKELADKLAADQEANQNFADWCRTHAEWRDRLEALYNRLFASERPESFSTKELPLVRAGGGVKLYGHQYQAIRKALRRASGIFAWDVGGGKTFGAIGQIAALRQEGRIHRPLVVVPKQVLTNWGREFQRMLPDYDVLLIGVTKRPRAVNAGDTLSKVRRQRAWREDTAEDKRLKWQRVAGGQCDVAICTHPNFKELEVEPRLELRLLEDNYTLKRQMAKSSRAAKLAERMLAHNQQLLEKAKDELKALKKSGVPEWSSSLKRLKKQVDSLQKKVNRSEADVKQAAEGTPRQIAIARLRFEQWVAKRATSKKEGLPYFEELGIDGIWIDEAHNFRNRATPNDPYGQQPKYLGASKGNCQGCWDLWTKARIVRDRNGGQGVILLTATPVVNSPLDLYALITLVRPDLLEARGIRTEDDFMARYLQLGVELTLKAKTGKMEEQLVVQGFTNLNELRSILALVLDYRTIEDLNRSLPSSRQIVLPDSRTEQHFVPMPPEARALYASYREAAKESGGGGTMFALMQEMHKTALDVRLIDAEKYQDSPLGPKLKELCRVISSCCSIPAATGPDGSRLTCAHLVFVLSNETIEWIVNELVDRGTPRERIATLTGEDDLDERQQVVDGINGVWELDDDGQEHLVTPPTVDVVIGNMKVMSEGMNLQKRACTCHFPELPWNPAALQQASGRAKRQGNLFGSVEFHYYLAERSFDLYRLQLVSGKGNWADSLFKGRDQSMSNPLAQSGLSANDIKVMMAENEEEARAQLEAQKAAAFERRLEEQREEGRRDFNKAMALYASAERHPDPDMRDRNITQARRLIQKSTANPQFAFKGQGVEPIPVGGTKYITKAGQILMKGASFLDYVLHQPVIVLSLDHARGVMRVRPLGSFVTRIMALENERLSPVVWDDKKDKEGLSSTERNASWINPSEISSVAPELLRGYAAVIWGRAKRARDEGEMLVPFLVDGTLKALPWSQAVERSDLPIMPTDEGWQRFLDLRGLSKEERRKVSSRWFKRVWKEEL